MHIETEFPGVALDYPAEGTREKTGGLRFIFDLHAFLATVCFFPSYVSGPFTRMGGFIEAIRNSQLGFIVETIFAYVACSLIAGGIAFGFGRICFGSRFKDTFYRNWVRYSLSLVAFYVVCAILDKSSFPLKFLALIHEIGFAAGSSDYF